MSRKYFFREDYSLEELIERISINDIRDTELTTVKNLIEAPTTDISESDLNGTAQEVYNTLQQKLTKTERYNFYSDILDECGDKGDILNLQFIFGDYIDESSLIDNLEDKKQDADPAELIESKIRNSIIDFKPRGDGIIDIRFVVPNEPEKYDIPNPDKYSDIIDNFYLEARVYCEEGIIAHSRRAVSDDEEDVLWRVLNTLCNSQLNRRSTISTNEMLAVQNAMRGENHGINYGDFDGGRNVNKARYRGISNLSPSDSTIVKPAAETGEITALLFYYSYKSGRKNRDVLIRLYNDAHITTSNIHTEPDIVDTIVEELARIKKYEGYFSTTNQIVNEYKFNLEKIGLVRGYESYLQDINKDLRAISNAHLPVQDIKKVEKQMFHDLIFNIAIKLLCVDLDEYPTPNKDFQSVEREGDFEEKLEIYRKYQTDCSQSDYDLFRKHLYNSLSIDFNRPVDLIEHVKDQYEV